MDVLCALFGKTKQAFYQRTRKSDNSNAKRYRILQNVREIRSKLPGCGVRKIHEMLRKHYTGYHIGRDRLFEILREEGMLVRRRKGKKRTTFSNHNYRVYPNAIVDVVPTRPNEIWVSDITYIQDLKKDYYLFLITDAYSHKIVGWDIADNMRVGNAIAALKMALKQRKDDKHLIHHSDRGTQYASYRYINALKRNSIMPSMTEHGDPRENAVAERINGIIKHEFIKYIELDERSIKRQIGQIIENYNNYRMHYSIGLMTPQEAHLKCGFLKKLWKKYPYPGANKKNIDTLVPDKKDCGEVYTVEKKIVGASNPNYLRTKRLGSDCP